MQVSQFFQKLNFYRKVLDRKLSELSKFSIQHSAFQPITLPEITNRLASVLNHNNSTDVCNANSLSNRKVAAFSQWKTAHENGAVIELLCFLST